MISPFYRESMRQYKEGTAPNEPPESFQRGLQWSLNVLQAALDGQELPACSTVKGTNLGDGRKMSKVRPGNPAHHVWYLRRYQDDLAKEGAELKARFKKVSSSESLLTNRAARIFSSLSAEAGRTAEPESAPSQSAAAGDSVQAWVKQFSSDMGRGAAGSERPSGSFSSNACAAEAEAAQAQSEAPKQVKIEPGAFKRPFGGKKITIELSDSSPEMQKKARTDKDDFYEECTPEMQRAILLTSSGTLQEATTALTNAFSLAVTRSRTVDTLKT